MLKDFSNMVNVGLLILGKNKNVVKIGIDINIQHIFENVINQGLR